VIVFAKHESHRIPSTTARQDRRDDYSVQPGPEYTKYLIREGIRLLIPRVAAGFFSMTEEERRKVISTRTSARRTTGRRRRPRSITAFWRQAELSF
jgi:hypothetical protein